MNETIGFWLLMSPLIGIMGAVLLLQLRFMMPIKWRTNRRWDKFLCRVGSHVCYSPCGMGCCWECVRCEASKKNKLDLYYNLYTKESLRTIADRVR